MVLHVSTSLLLPPMILLNKTYYLSTNIHPTTEPSTPTHVNAEENNNDQAEFTNPFCTRYQRNVESSHANIGQGKQDDKLATDPKMCMLALHPVILFSIHNDEWEISFQCHHQTALRRPYALSWKPCQGDSLNLPDHRIHKDGDGDASFQLKSDSLHMSLKHNETFYKLQDSRIHDAQELKTSNFRTKLWYTRSSFKDIKSIKGDC
ncbi:hypothetical protein Tco_0966413 [Tanacetum coccineum]